MNTPRENGFQVAKQPGTERQCCLYFVEVVVYDCRIGHVNCKVALQMHIEYGQYWTAIVFLQLKVARRRGKYTRACI
jgi:hypothetical protein